MTAAPDPFGTADLRRVVLDAWAASAARFREDANAEDLLAAGGYAGRALVELAANGVDAARDQAGAGAAADPADRRRAAPRQHRVAADRGRRRRRSPPCGRRPSGDAAGSVGFFGVGFTAVLTWTSAPRVVSTHRWHPIRRGRHPGRGRGAGHTGAGPELTPARRSRPGAAPALADRPGRGTAAGRFHAPRSGCRSTTRCVPRSATCWPIRTRRGPVVGAARADRDRPAGPGDPPARPARTAPSSSTTAGRTSRRSGWSPGRVSCPRSCSPAARSSSGAGRAGRSAGCCRSTSSRRRTAAARTYTVGRTVRRPTSRRRCRPGWSAPCPSTTPAAGWPPVRCATICSTLAADVYLDLVADDRSGRALAAAAGRRLPGRSGRRDAARGGRAPAESTPLLRTAVGDLVDARSGVPAARPGRRGRRDASGRRSPGCSARSRRPPRRPAAVGHVDARLVRRSAPRWPAWTGRRRSGGRSTGLPPMPIPDPASGRSGRRPGPTGRRAARGGRPRLPAAGRTGGEGGAGSAGVDLDLARRIGAVVPDLRVVHPDAVHPLLARLGAAPAEPSAVLADPALADRVEDAARRVGRGRPRPRRGAVRRRASSWTCSRPAANPTRPDAGRPGAHRRATATPGRQPSCWYPDAALADLLDPEVDRVLVGAAWLARYGPDAAGPAPVSGTASRSSPSPTRFPTRLADRLPDLDEWLELGQAVDRETFLALADLDLIDETGGRRRSR